MNPAMIPWLEDHTPFPSLDDALTGEDGAAGLLAAGADLSAERLLDAYRKGIFPWFSDGQPILWWSTDPRMVLKLDDFKISRSLKKTIRKLQNDDQFEIKFDHAFEQVMQHCAAPRDSQGGTWITGPIITAYTALHRRGYAHSVELWHKGELMGGAYGVCIGRMFYGESMFARMPDASKVALAYLVHFLKQRQVPMIDCQQQTGHLASLGARPIARRAFIEQIAQLVDQPAITDWHPDGAGV